MSKHHDDENKIQLQSYQRLLKYASRYWKKLTLGIVAGILVGGSLLVSLLMIPQLVGIVEPVGAKGNIEVVETNKTTSNTGDPQLDKLLSQISTAAETYHLPIELKNRNIEVLWPVNFEFEIVDENNKVAWQIFAFYVIGFVLAWLVKNLATYINHYYTGWVGNRIVADLRNDMFKKLLKQSLGYYGNMDVGQMISRSISDTATIEAAVAKSIGDLTVAPIQIFACVAAVFIACRNYDNYSMIVIILIGSPVVFVPVHFIGRKIRKSYRKTLSKISLVFSRMHEVFTGIRVVKAYNTEEMEIKKFNEINNQFFKEMLRAMRFELLLTPSSELIAVVASLAFLVFSYSQGVSLTQIAALLAPAFMAYQPLKSISKVFGSIQRSMAAADRYFSIMDTDTSLHEKENAIELKEFKKSIDISDVVFAYSDHKIIDGLNFSIPIGKMVAVVGETGSGKTTIANLIARLYDVSAGSVKIDGYDVRDYSIASLRKHIGIVNQDAILFNDTIANNIAYGCPNATMDDIINAAKLANAHNFIVDGRHADGYNSDVGEKGFKLSGGERQRLSIARAILRNPPILILDEATSALDTVTEKLVQEALARVMENRTVFAIAHRLSTIRNADLIIVLKNGKIVESGNHELLLKQSGIYKRLYDTQFELDA